MYRCVCVELRVDMRVDAHTDTCVDARVDLYADARVDACVLVMDISYGTLVMAY